jgi:large subunit ribosomal protein L6
MSRIGKKPVAIGKAKVAVAGQKVSFDGPKGKLELHVHPIIKVELKGTEVVIVRPDDEKQSKALHGLTRALIANNVEGVTNGFNKTLEMRGVGYKAELKGKNLVLSVGLANQVSVAVPQGLAVKVEPGANEVAARIVIDGIDRQLVGDFAAKVRKVRKPEPYKGKGIRYVGEKVISKPGKAFGGAGAK